MKKLMFVTAVYSVALMSGCASSIDQSGNNGIDYQSELNARNQELEIRNQEIATLKQQLDKSELQAKQSSSQASQQVSLASPAMSNDLLPPNAKAGQCFARVYTPPTYRTESESVLKAEGYDVVEIIPAVYGTEKETVLSQEASAVLEVIPAVYGWKEEQVLVSPEITELQRVPAQYKFVEDKLLVKPAHSIWKKGSGPITKIDASTGEIMCLVEIPAVYETVKKQVLVSPETTKEVVVKQAIYKTIKTRVVEQPARTVTRKLPAVYDTVAVKKLVKPASTRTAKVDPVYKSVNTTIKVTDGSLKWTPILCETNVTGDIIRDLQRSLNEKQYKAGPVDGIYGKQTTAAVRKYQSDKSMPGNGQLTIELVEALDLKY